jgi:hypothetical protein
VREKILAEEMHRRFKAQGVSGRDHIAFKCVMCGTVQSLASLKRAGVPPDKAENYIGFSCEGRFNGAGEWPSDPKKQKARKKRGCNWTLGGLFQIHELEVTTPDGKLHPSFVVATPEEAKALERAMEPIEITWRP